MKLIESDQLIDLSDRIKDLGSSYSLEPRNQYKARYLSMKPRFGQIRFELKSSKKKKKGNQ